jgi:superfamily II DNA helicase RecQ
MASLKFLQILSINYLFVSPALYVNVIISSFPHLIKLLHQTKGPDAVSLLCVDEAHWISQWSYNFRPAFLRIRKEIDYIQPTSILAMTATATPRIKEEIVSHLRITDDSVCSIPSRREKPHSIR